MAFETESKAMGPGPKPAAVATGAMVATSHPGVTAAALDVLVAGGTAIDAVLTAIPLQQVLEPQLSTIAGGFGMLIWDGQLGRSTYLNAGPDRPRGSASTAGHQVTSGSRVAVPGTVAGLAAVAERLGTREWASYFEPAVRAADEGFVMYGQLATAMAAARAHLVRYPSGEERYTPDGHLPRVGDVIRGLSADVDALLEFWLVAGENASRPFDSRNAVLALLRRDPGALIVAQEHGRLIGSVVA